MMTEYNFILPPAPTRGGIGVDTILIRSRAICLGRKSYGSLNKPEHVLVEIDKDAGAIRLTPSDTGKDVKVYKKNVVIYCTTHMPTGKYHPVGDGIFVKKDDD